MYRTLRLYRVGKFRFGVDYEHGYWSLGVTLGKWYARVEIGALGFYVVRVGE